MTGSSCCERPPGHLVHRRRQLQPGLAVGRELLQPEAGLVGQRPDRAVPAEDDHSGRPAGHVRGRLLAQQGIAQAAAEVRADPRHELDLLVTEVGFVLTAARREYPAFRGCHPGRIAPRDGVMETRLARWRVLGFGRKPEVAAVIEQHLRTQGIEARQAHRLFAPDLRLPDDSTEREEPDNDRIRGQGA
jgi:hypothetical protein